VVADVMVSGSSGKASAMATMLPDAAMIRFLWAFDSEENRGLVTSALYWSWKIVFVELMAPTDACTSLTLAAQPPPHMVPIWFWLPAMICPLLASELMSDER